MQRRNLAADSSRSSPSPTTTPPVAAGRRPTTMRAATMTTTMMGAWRRRRCRAILAELTSPRPSRALYVAASFLSLGLVLVLGRALVLRSDDDVSSSSRLRVVVGPESMLVTGGGGLLPANPYAAMMKDKDGKERRRLAVIIPYLPASDGAPTFPPYFDIFATSAAGSSSHIDFLVFHCFVPTSLLPDANALPANVRLIDMNERNDDGGAGEGGGGGGGGGGKEEEEVDGCGLARLFTRVTDARREDGKTLKTPLETLIRKLSRQIINYPYILVEYKPAFGHIFADYLVGYTHWGYSDLDVVFGDMSRWIDDDEWNDYDVVTYGYGDQDKLYLRGQFTFHRNDPVRINQLWRHCKYLSEMDVRYAHPETLKFESAEGCYSQAVLIRNDIRVKWAVKAATDYLEESPIYSQGVYLSLGSMPSSMTSSVSYRPKSVLYTASTLESGRQLLALPHDWFEDKVLYPKYNEDGLSIQKYVGERTRVETYRMLHDAGDESAANVKCMFWAPKTYQMDICTVDGNVGSDEVVILEGGILYKQKFVQRRTKLFPEGISSFPFFHFQEWKRIYRTTELLPSHNIRSTNTMSGLIVTKEGTLPLFSPTSTSPGWNFKRDPRSWSTSATSAWMSADTGSTVTRPTGNKFCLHSSPKGHPKGATVCKVAASWPRSGVSDNILLRDSASVTVLRSPNKSSPPKTGAVRGKKADSEMDAWWDGKFVDANKDVTLALTLQITHSHMNDKTLVQNLLALADSNIYMWGARQPSVLLIHVDHSQDDVDLYAQTTEMIKDLFAPKETSSMPHLRNSLVAIVDSFQHATVSRKALMNMATHAAPTRWILSGLEVERGLLLSSEASVYAMREARVYADMPGYVFVIPQFASTRDDIIDDEANNRFPTDRNIYSGVGASSLPSLRGKQTMVSNLSKYDCVKCASGDSQAGDDDTEEPGARRLTDVHSSATGKNVEELIEDLWWDLSVADVYGTPGGFSGEARSSVDAMAKIHDSIEVSLVSLLDLKGEQLEYLQNFDKSPILMIDRLGPKKEMMTLDLAPEVEEFRGRKCYHLLRLAQLAAFGYKVGVLQGAFAVSYPKTRDALCTESIQQSGPVQCKCELDSEGTIKEILIDEAKRPAKVAVLMNEHDSAVVKMH